MEENKKKQITLAILGGLFLLILVIGAAYSYFQVVANNNTSTSTITGNSELVGQATLTTHEDGKTLKLNITAEMMNSSNVNTTYYATPGGTPVTTATDGSGIYTLATASLTESEVPVYCTYTYDITATASKTISDGSDADYKVVIIESNGAETTYTLAELLSGVTHTGKINSLTYGTNQTLKIKAYVTNTESNQNDLSGNTIGITITPKSGTEGFSCDTVGPASEKLIASGELWQSGLEDDGYRYTGTGVTCSYDNGNYIGVADNQYTTPSCPTIYNYTRTTISDGSTTDYTYETSCPSNDSTYTYSCTELPGIIIESSKNTIPNNFICFGTTDKTECKNNEAKYMYRIIGVFEGSDGEQHLKLISLKQLGAYAWHGDTYSDVAWENSDMYTGLNGEYFLTNTTYDYLQNSTWLNKIENWTWSAVNTKTSCAIAPYYNSLTPSEIYLHEMNRSSKSSSIGEWSTPTAKIGLMYASDYVLSLGSSALSITGGTVDNKATLKTGWMHQSNNDTSADTFEWTLSRIGYQGGLFVWSVTSIGILYNFGFAEMTLGVRPVFYLTSNVVYKSGTGTYADPYIIG